MCESKTLKPLDIITMNLNLSPYEKYILKQNLEKYYTQKLRCEIDASIAEPNEIYEAEIINDFILDELLEDLKK